MTLAEVVLQVVAVVAALHVLGLYAIAPPLDRNRALRTLRRNARAVAVPGAVLGGVLAVNGVVRDIGVELSWLVGLNVTSHIHRLERGFVAEVQSLATPGLTAYFAFVYVFGYVFLLTFPPVVYAFHEDEGPLRTTLIAYSLNYGLGLVCYVLFVAYGPRNFMPGQVESLLYTAWPQSQFLTSTVNVNTNVFPSLHTSLSVTVALLASRYRSVAPRWRPVAWLLAVSISVSTMYLGIHWLTDVVGGVGLAVFSVVVAARFPGIEVGDEGGGSEETDDGEDGGRWRPGSALRP